MPELLGFEPQVGEIRALRTFRIGPHGRLFPLFHDHAWSADVNTADCSLPWSAADPAIHIPPEPDCTCGFYSFSSETAALDYPHSRHVLAVVACWGRIIVGTRGIRAQFARLEAIWTSAAVPAGLVDEVAARYRNAVVYSNQETMLNRHPITAADSDPSDPAPARYRRPAGLRLAGVGVLVLSLPDAQSITGPPVSAVVWMMQLGLLVTVIMTSRRANVIGARQQWVLLVAAVAWMLAPIAGLAGWLLIRIPMIEVAALVARQQRLQANDSRRFPARIGPVGRSPRRPGRARGRGFRRDPPVL